MDSRSSAQRALEFAVVARDPLARVGLSALLEASDADFHAGPELTPAQIDQGIGPQIEHSDAVLWEYDPQDAIKVAGLSASIPVVVFVDDAEAGHDAWARGARAVLARDIDAKSLAVALPAALAGLRVLDPSLELELGARAHTPPPNAPALSKRESEVLALLADGASNKEVGTSLGVSVNTAKFHVRSILDKLGAESRTEAVVLAARWGLIIL